MATAKSRLNGKAPRVTVRAFAESAGVSVQEVKMYQRMAKRYNDAATKWANRNEATRANLWRPWTLESITRARNLSPAEAFEYALETLQAKLGEGVSNLLNTRKEDYVNNLMSAIASSEEFLEDERMQQLLDLYERGKISTDDIFRATGGESFKALYKRSKGNDEGGSVSIDFTPLLDRLTASGVVDA